MRNKLILLSCFIILAACSVQAQGWNAVQFPSTENINGVSFVNEDTAFFVTNKGTLIRTFDGLKSFDGFNPTPEISLEDVLFLNSEVGYICGANGTFMKTTDGGYTFKQIPVNNMNSWFFDIEMFDESHGLIIGMVRDSATPYGGITYRTSDGGKNWTEIKPYGIGLSEIGYQNGKVYVQSFGRMNSSTDFGKTWVSDSTISGSPGRSFSYFEKNGILCGMSGTCAYSSDGGKSWKPSEQNPEVMFIASQMVNNTVGYIGGTKTTLMKTVDGGKSWNPELMAKSFDVFDFALVKDRLYAVGSFGGVIWKKVK